LENSELLCDQIKALDVGRLIPEKLAFLSTKEMLEVEQQVQLILDFE
jgi:mRNA-degrading endonuclease toxin of MazEF toxin-antitoxin module